MLQLFVALALISAANSVFYEEYRLSSAVPEGAVLVFAWPTPSALRIVSALAQRTAFPVLVHRGIRLVAPHVVHDSKPVVSAVALAKSLGLSVLHCGVGGVVWGAACAGLLTGEPLSDNGRAVCLASIYADQAEASLRCVAEVAKPALVIYDSLSMFGANVALRFGVPAVLLHSQQISDALVEQLLRNGELSAACAEFQAPVCAALTDADKLAHAHGHLVVDWFDASAAPVGNADDGVLRLLPFSSAMHAFDAAYDLSTDGSRELVGQFLARQTPFVLVSLGDFLLEPSALFIGSLTHQLSTFCHDGQACRVLWARSSLTDIDWLLAVPGSVAHLGVFQSRSLRAVVSSGDPADVADALANRVPLVLLPLDEQQAHTGRRFAALGVAVVAEAVDTIAAALTSASGAADDFHAKWRAADADRVVVERVLARLAPPPPPPPPIVVGLSVEKANEGLQMLREMSEWGASLKAAKQQPPQHTEL
jgi:hypothetical protein